MYLSHSNSECATHLYKHTNIFHYEKLKETIKAAGPIRTVKQQQTQYSSQLFCSN